MDLMDDSVFGPMNLIGRGAGMAASLGRSSKSKRRHAFSPQDTVRVAIPRPDKGGSIPVLQVMEHVQQYGVDVVGGRNAVTHDARNFYIVIPLRQMKYFQWLYNNGELQTPKRAWKDNTGTARRVAHSPQRTSLSSRVANFFRFP